MLALKPFFVVPLPLSSIAGPSVLGYPAAHLGRSKALGLTWRNPGGGTVSGSFGSPQQVDFCALLSANAKPDTTIRVEVGGYDSGVRPFISPAIQRADGLYHSHIEFPAVQLASDWSITIGHSGVFESSILVLGRRIQPKRFYDRDIEYGVEDLGSADIARNGVWNETSGPILRSVGMVLNWHSEAEWEQDFRPMVERVGTSQPLYLCFDPQPSAYRQNRTFYGSLRKAPAVTARPKPGTYGADYKLLSVI